MAKQVINIGTTANDGTGDPLRDAFDKVNDNFDELYTIVDEQKRVRQMALAEAFTIASGATYDANSIISAANIVWSDGENGTISNVTTDAFGISSIRYNRPSGKYATVNITRGSDGNITATTVVLTGY